MPRPQHDNVDSISSSDEDDTLAPGKHVTVVKGNPAAQPPLGSKRKLNNLIESDNLILFTNALSLGTQPVVSIYPDSPPTASSSTPPLGPQHIPPSSGQIVFRLKVQPNNKETPVTALTSVTPTSSLSSSKETEI